MTAVIAVFDPTAPERRELLQKRRVLDSLKGKVVGFIDNSKPNFYHLVDDMADLLLARHGVKSVVKRRKPTAGAHVGGALGPGAAPGRAGCRRKSRYQGRPGPEPTGRAPATRAAAMGSS